jgi:hypothetical protein
MEIGRESRRKSQGNLTSAVRDGANTEDLFMDKGKLGHTASIIFVLILGLMVGVFFHYLMHRLILNMESFIYIIF